MPDNNKTQLLDSLYDMATGDEDARVCKDIPEESCHHQPHNFFAYLCSNVFSKVADELCSARLVFPWLVGALGIPTVFAGFLVPIREAGVLLPQLVVAAYIRRMAVRKWAWITGALLSALAIGLLMAGLEGASGSSAGWLLIGLLTFYSLARGISSVSAKDVVGKTVSKTRRGRLMGYATSISGIAILLIGLLIHFRPDPGKESALLTYILGGGVVCYLVSAALFALIREHPGATAGGANALGEAVRSLGIVTRDRDFRQFMISRTLLLSIALAPPFYTLLAQRQGGDLAGLGILILVSGLASVVSAPIWGRMSDRSSRKVMALSALLSGIVGMGVMVAALAMPELIGNVWVPAAAFFLITVFHAGARLGRKTYLVDMANSDNRATYVAVSNTLIGVFMLAGGAIGFLADLLSVEIVLGILGAISLLAALYIVRIREVSE